MLESVGISVEFSHHEGAPGQNEIDLRYADALSTADNIMTFRTVIKEVALEQGGVRHLHAEGLRRVPGPAGCTPTCRSSRVTPMPSTSRA
ncbi:glutamine synthetase, partial [Janibacter hoylei PVAS-1]